MTAATCTSVGYQARDCSGCGNREMSVISTLSHDMERDKEISAATCEQPGKLADKCRVCGTEQNVRTIPATGHYTNGSVETFAIQDAETGEWARMTYRCENDNGYIAGLKWVSFCADCESQGTLYCSEEHVHDLIEEPSNNEYHCANTDEYVHLYKEVRDTDGTLVDTLWVGTHRCLTCDYIIKYSYVQEHAVAKTDGQFFCTTCNEYVEAQEAPEDFPNNWCNLCGHTWSAWIETEQESLPETEHRKEKRHCLFAECEEEEERDIHVAGYESVMLFFENSTYKRTDYYCRDIQTEIPEGAFLANVCTICEMNQVITPMGTRTPISQCIVTTEEEDWDSPEPGATEMVTHVCPPELVHLYCEVESGDNPTILTAAGRQCIYCYQVYEAGKHVMTPVDADRTTWYCETCNKNVEALNDTGGELYRGWCGLYDHVCMSEHAYISYNNGGEDVTLGARKEWCELCWEYEVVECHTLLPSEVTEGMFYCENCQHEVEAIEDNGHDFIQSWCELYGHQENMTSALQYYTFYCDRTEMAIYCWACGAFLEYRVATEDTIPEHCSEEMREAMLTVEEHDLTWSLRYTSEETGEELLVELNEDNNSVFTAEELAGAELTGTCRRNGRYPLSGTCPHREVYNSTTEQPITDLFNYSDDLGGYRFVGPVE